MKLRTAYFCRNCDEEVNLEKIEMDALERVFKGIDPPKNGQYLPYHECPHCKFSNTLNYVPLVYEWKVEDLEYELPEGMNYGDCSPIDFLERIYNGTDKPENENTKTISKKKRKISNR